MVIRLVSPKRLIGLGSSANPAQQHKWRVVAARLRWPGCRSQSIRKMLAHACTVSPWSPL